MLTVRMSKLDLVYEDLLLTLANLQNVSEILHLPLCSSRMRLCKYILSDELGWMINVKCGMQEYNVGRTTMLVGEFKTG